MENSNCIKMRAGSAQEGLAAGSLCGVFEPSSDHLYSQTYFGCPHEDFTVKKK